jgi:hypothetical protein
MDLDTTTNNGLLLSSFLRHVAEQWTLIDWEMFRAIPGYELLALAWEKPRCVQIDRLVV